MPTQPRTYDPSTPFPGRIGRTLETSEPAWPGRPQPPAGAPNVVIIVLDDVGYGQLSAYGGLCETPNLDKVADRGLRFANFHTTALCSPTRACLLTGRNHHATGMSAISELAVGYPSHNAIMAPEHGMLSEILSTNGYNTFCVGKWHLTPPEESTAAGPFDRWPLGRGFERFYGFMAGDTDQWHPELVEDNHQVPAPSKPADGYHLNIDLADHAIGFIRDAHVAAPDKPFLLWYATGAAHSPHQVEPEWIEKYEGRFDAGWDAYRDEAFSRQLDIGLIPAGTELPERDPDVPAWDSLNAEARRMYTRQMEVYAGFISQTDHHIGRVIDFIESIGELDNTMVICVSDNGASAEGGEHGSRNSRLFMNLAPENLEDSIAAYDTWGGPDTFTHYAWGWTWAGDTPFRRWKRETYRGGITDPCIVSWPAGIAARGEVRNQYAHAIDVLPTLLDVIGLSTPANIRGVPQSPLHGVSLATALNDAASPEVHETQYFEMLGHRSIYDRGWKATCAYPAPTLEEARDRGRPFGTPLSESILDELELSEWELYDLRNDPAECQNLAASNPEKLRELQQLWWQEAETYGVLPLAGAEIARLMADRPSVASPRDVYEFLPGSAPLSFGASPRVTQRAHSITASVTIPPDGADGVLLTAGTRHGGYALYVKGDRLHFVHNYMGMERFTVSADEPLPRGTVELRMEFKPTAGFTIAGGRGCPANVALFHDRVLVGSGQLPYTVPVVFSSAGVSCGEAFIDTVDPTEFDAPARFTGGIKNVVVDLTGELIINAEAEFARLFGEQ